MMQFWLTKWRGGIKKKKSGNTEEIGKILGHHIENLSWPELDLDVGTAQGWISSYTYWKGFCYHHNKHFAHICLVPDSKTTCWSYRWFLESASLDLQKPETSRSYTRNNRKKRAVKMTAVWDWPNIYRKLGLVFYSISPEQENWRFLMMLSRYKYMTVWKNFSYFFHNYRG